jgi:hypothetical protein
MIGIQNLLDIALEEVIIAKLLRWCWNWQTGMVEGHVPQGMGVQVPPSAQCNRLWAVHLFNPMDRFDPTNLEG